MRIAPPSMIKSQKKTIKSVLYITDSTKHSSGGNRQLILNAEAMIHAGIEVFVIVPPDSGIARALKNSSVKLISRRDIVNICKTAFFLRSFTQKNKIDVVHTFHNKSIKSAIIAKLLGAKYRLFLNRGVIYRPNALAWLFARISDGYICNSNKAAEILQKAFVPRDKTHIVYNAVAPFHQTISHQNIRNTIRVIYIGNNNPVKGFDIFLHAAFIVRATHNNASIEFHAYGTDAEPSTYPHIPSEAFSGVIPQSQRVS